jgi:hypothetical protein
MAEIIRNRTIRPSTRKESSVNYRVDISKVLKGDTLIVNVNHESQPFKKSYYFEGNTIAERNNLSFRVGDYGNRFEIVWNGVQPFKEL